MNDQPIQRRLAAILAADIAGYTRLMNEDEDATIAAWQSARTEVIKPSIVATLPGRVEADSHNRARQKPTDNMAAYDACWPARCSTTTVGARTTPKR